jgi:hypothetical protein
MWKIASRGLAEASSVPYRIGPRTGGKASP